MRCPAEDSGIWNALADHYSHEIGGGYDWHRNDTIDLSLKVIPRPTAAAPIDNPYCSCKLGYYYF